LLRDYVRAGKIPSRDHINSGIFASHYFNINPQLDEVDDVIAVRFFSSRLHNPIKRQDEHLFVIGVTGSADGKNERPKTDIILVLDRSGSMSCALTSVPYGNQPPQSGVRMETKMALTIEAAKQIFDLLDDDECIGVLAFDDCVEIVETLKRKMTIDRTRLFEALDGVQPRGGTNMEIGLSKAVEMMQLDPNSTRNKRIIFITDACPNAGSNEYGLRVIAERAFVASSRTTCVTYAGVGLSFNAQVCNELARVRGTTVFTVNTAEELRQTLVEDFNYLITPIAFDVKVCIESDGVEIDGSRVYGADDDARKSGSMLEIRTLTGSSIRGNGVKGSVIVAFLKAASADALHNARMRVRVEYLPFGEAEVQQRVYESVFKFEVDSVVEKAFALSVYYETLKQILPPGNQPRDSLSDPEKAAITALRDFLTSQAATIRTDLGEELQMVNRILS
jgi:Ca-activated chloride channel family protein